MADREKVINGLQNLRDAIATDFIHEVDQAVGTIDDAIALLKEQEAVVRCKDCKYYRATPGYCAYDRIWQENKGHVWGMYCKPDWFCADGEKREEKQ